MCRGRPDLDVDHMLTLTIPNSGPILCRIENSGGWWLTNKIGQGQIHSFQQGPPLNCSDCFDEVYVPVWHELFDVRPIWTVQTVQCSIDLNYSHSQTMVPFGPNTDCLDFGGPCISVRNNRVHIMATLVIALRGTKVMRLPPFVRRPTAVNLELSKSSDHVELKIIMRHLSAPRRISFIRNFNLVGLRAFPL